MARLIEDHIRLVFVLLLALFTAGFLLFFTWYQDIVFKHAQERLRQDALVIAESLWRYETPPFAYLILSARSNSYRTVQVIDDSQKEYAAVKGQAPSFTERIMARAGLLPVVELEEPVRYQNRTIGTIEVDWQNRAAFIYFYVIICQVLLFAGLWFFLNLYIAKKTLEERVKERTADLRVSRARLQSILDSMPSVLIGVDPAGNITLWNNRAEQVSGFLTEEALDRPLEKVYPRLAPRMDQVREAIATRRERVSKKQARMQDNLVCYEDITVFPLVANGVEGAVIRVDDITDQVRMEEMIIQSEKMLSVGGLAAGMAHEINNPLAGIMQTANVMKLRLENIDIAANKRAASDIGISTQQVRAFMEKRGIFNMLDAINESGARVSVIVDNMLSFARKSDAIVSSHNPAELMDSILELAATDYDLKKQYDFKTIKIVREYEENLPMIPCEGAKVQQVILNI
ncbi:MAG TPA: PAS domain S-box protein, partial [Desulfobacter postgatei]|nr:PAS domain S-box protein [Desulfobacter postgatei]